MKVAVLGAGGMGLTVVEHLLQCEGVSGILTHDLSHERIQAIQQKTGVLGTTNLQDVLKDSDVRLVFITASNIAHKDLTLQAIRAGKAVFCEKPMATTLADAREMISTAREYRAFLQIGFELRYSKLFTAIMDWIEAGLLGRVVNTHCRHAVAEYWGRDSWRIHEASGGMFGEKLCHYVDLPRFWIRDQVTEVISICAPNVVPYFKVRDNYHTTYRFAGGAVSHLTFTMGPPSTYHGDPLIDVIDQQKEDGHILHYQVVGTRGAAEADVFRRKIKRWEFCDSEKGFSSTLVEECTWDKSEDHFYFHNTFDQTHDLVRRVSLNLSPKTSAEDSYETMKLVFAAELSATEGRLIKLEE